MKMNMYCLDENCLAHGGVFICFKKVNNNNFDIFRRFFCVHELLLQSENLLFIKARLHNSHVLFFIISKEFNIHYIYLFRYTRLY